MKRMMSFKVGVLVSGLVMGGGVYAGPKVTVVFKNQGSESALNVRENSNENSTYLNSSPKPENEVFASCSNSYDVQSLISPNTNWAYVRYRMGRKECVFSTTYVNMMGAGGSMTPKWTKAATPSNGATCTATITKTNYNDHTWVVEFLMR
ncbi:hypothetical protein [Pseudomonas sp. nanlin1]|uniref:hypothetical protein n=1 Tax=Pseudomonas sp. nanlin1 TaxID=3040605 RepID=UPI0038903537